MNNINKNLVLQQFIKKHISLIILCILIILLTIGIVSVWSISAPLSEFRRSNIGFKYLVLVGISIVLAVLVYFFVTFKQISENTLLFLYLVGFIFLLSPLVLGHSINGARRWITLGFIQIQPSEFAKPILIYIFSVYFNELKDVINREIIFLNNKIKAHAGITIVWSILVIFYCLAVFAGKALTSTLQIALLSYLMLCVSNVENKYKKNITFLGFISIPLLLIFKGAYRIERLTQFQGGGSQQTLEGITAIKTGFLFGRGFGSGFQKYFYLSEAHTDYIFSAIAEELGLILSLFILCLFIALVSLIFYAGINAKNSIEKYVIFGVGFVLTNQVVAHVGINLGILPSTGITLPFISYGGSALMSNLICMGLLFKALDNMEWKVIK